MKIAGLALALLGACGEADPGPAAPPGPRREDEPPQIPVSLTGGIDPGIESPAALTWRFRIPVSHGLMLLALGTPASLDVSPIVRVERLRGGSFRLERAPPGLHTVFVRGWRTRWRQQTVCENETTDLGTIELEPFPSADMVEGIVRDAWDRPLQGLTAREIVQESCVFDMCDVTYFRTQGLDEEGTFLICPAVNPSRLAVFGPDFAWGGFEMEWGERFDLVARRSEPGTSALPFDWSEDAASDRAPSRTRLTGTLQRSVIRGRLLLARGWLQELDGASIAFAGDVDGDLFRFEHAPAGTYTVFLRGWRSRWHREPIHLEEGRTTELGPIDLALVPNEEFVEGVVRDDHGEPLPGVRIEYGPSLESADADVAGTSTLSREDGSFLVIPPDPEPRLRFRKEGFASQETEGRTDRLLDVVLRRDS